MLLFPDFVMLSPWLGFFFRMLSADFAAAAVLISFGAVLGKVSSLQLLIMATIEVILAQLNEYIGLHKLHVSCSKVRG